ncbi:MAG: TetR family transcriptional regulator [Catenulispora sp. 13_1_20CM_3_70_7]|jgi:AcrR family transcriptional regulator|nr:MAG: TetR family transcriptional regulator [Catenulispora sp. 13_1_20CM_3_70_7]
MPNPQSTSRTGPLSGRKAQANRNDEAILHAARQVFIADPAAPISAVAKEAGVGISALYRRYESKEVLLQTLCADGLATYIACAEAALASDAGPWERFTSFVRAVIDADVHALTVSLAGTFTPTEEMFRQTARAVDVAGRIFQEAHEAGVVRSDFAFSDIAMLLEQLTAVSGPNPERTRELRHRYLAMHFDALRPEAARGEMPGPPPSDEELGARWIPRG